MASISGFNLEPLNFDTTILVWINKEIILNHQGGGNEISYSIIVGAAFFACIQRQYTTRNAGIPH